MLCKGILRQMSYTNKITFPCLALPFKNTISISDRMIIELIVLAEDYQDFIPGKNHQHPNVFSDI